MPLTSGTRLGPYEVIAAIGAGGMGEVYRARDGTLNRDVALKVLPEPFARDADRLARFRREAQVLAALNHPNIAAIYGFEESTPVHALVLELVEGPTLADRITQGPIPVDEALPMAKQIADALEAAHEQGIIHRDLKPGNVKVRPDGTVKVLDFGLAKALEPTVARVDATASPTITSPAMMTGVGVLLGTAAYMSPEQAKGHPADKRSDVWAFGAVLYEMLTGRRAFDGEDMTEVLGAVVRLEPKWDALPNDVPPPVRMLLQRCLVKDRRRRITDIAAALFVLEHHTGLAAAGTASAAVERRTPRWRRVGALTGVLFVVAATGAAVWFVMRPVSPSVVRTAITTSGSAALSLQGSDRDIVITPDGSRVVYRGNNQLLVRRLDQLEPTVLSGLGAPRGVFISPDGQWVGFSDDTSIKKVAITGGPPVTIASVGRVPRGATWGPDETIIFSTGVSATGLQKVSAAGGEPTELTKPDRGRGEALHVWPEFLPGGGAVLFTITSAGDGIENAQVAVLDVRTGKSKVLIRNGSHAHYVPTGHLVYGVAGTLRAVTFDLGRLEVVGTPTPVLDGVVTTVLGAADVAVAVNGSLVYVRGNAPGRDPRALVSVDRQGRGVPLPGLPHDSYQDVRVSPDGTRFALATRDDVWIYDFARATLSRLTTDPAPDRSPLWTPDGQRVVFTSLRAGYPELFSRSADGAGRDERLLTRAKDLVDLRASSWSQDGSRLLFIEVTEVPPTRQSAVWQIAPTDPSDAKVLLQSASYNHDHASVSPNGRWMAYTSNVSGRSEIYVERYPELGNKQLISTGGGRLPLWSRDGSELFFTQDGRQMLAVPIRSGTTFDAGPPKVLFEFAIGIGAAPFGNARPYDIARDGRFLIVGNAGAETGRGTEPSMIVVQNWFEELKRLVPVN